MKQIDVTMEWSEPNQKWLMKAKKTGNLINDFWDCHFMPYLFDDLEKNKINEYHITIDKKYGSF
jgi:hypothetical protein